MNFTEEHKLHIFIGRDYIMNEHAVLLKCSTEIVIYITEFVMKQLTQS